MLCALKWLGLLCKSRLARLVLLLTGRVVLLADVATAYLERPTCFTQCFMQFQGVLFSLNKLVVTIS